MKKIILFIIILAICASSALAGESFSIGDGQQQVNSYGCTSGSISFSVINNNPPVQSITYTVNNENTAIETQIPVSSTYTVGLSGGAGSWSSAAPSRFALASGQQEQITVFYNIPCGTVGQSQLVISVTTDKGLNQQFAVDINIGKSQNLRLIPIVNNFVGCPCKQAVFEYIVQNSGSFTETYSMGADQFSQYATVSESQITLNSGQSRTVYLYLTTPCDVYGDYQGTFSVTAQNNQMVAETPYFITMSACYQFATYIGKMSSTDVTAQTFQYSNASYSICEGQYSKIPVLVKNNADIANSYSFKLTYNPAWASLGADTMSLGPKESGVIMIPIGPTIGTNGNYQFNLNTATGIGNLATDLQIPVSVVNCNAPKIISPKELDVNYTAQTNQIQITNTGSKTTTYTLGLTGASFARLNPKTINLQSAETGNIDIITEPGASDASGTYPVLISATADGIDYGEQLNIVLGEQTANGPGILSILGAYIWYILAGLLLLIFLIAAIILAATKPKKAKEEQIKHEGKIEKVYESVKEEKKALQQQLREKKLAQKQALIEERKQARLEERRVKLEEREKARKEMEKSKRKKKNYAGLIFAIFVIICLLGIGYFAYQYYKQQTPTTTVNETKPVGATPHFNISQPSVNATAQPHLNLGDRVKQFYSVYKTYVIVALVIVGLILLGLMLSIIKNKKRFLGWLIAIAIIVAIVVVAMHYKQFIHAVTKPVNQTQNITVNPKPAYQQDQLLKLLENGTYGYDNNGHVVQISTGKSLTTAEFVQLLDKDRNQIIAGGFSESELNLTIRSLQIISGGKIPQETQTQENETVIEKENFTAPRIKNFEFPANCSIEMIQDVPRTVSLSYAFYDPDGDLLNYWTSMPDNITITITGDSAELVPGQGFVGVNHVVITADDGKNGTATSGNLTICVRAADAEQVSQWQSARGFVQTYFWYISAGIAVLIVVVILITVLERRRKIDVPKPRKKRK